jgi:hypothetical protein
MLRAFGYGTSAPCAPEGSDGTGGGDGGDAGHKPLTEEDVGRIVNQAVTAQLGRSLPKAVEGAISAIKFEDLLTPIVQKLSPPPQQGGGQDGGGQSGADHGGHITTKTLQDQVQKLATELESEKKARAAAEQQKLETERRAHRSSAKQAFTAAVQGKVRPELLGVFVDHYADSQGLLKVADDGKATVTVKVSPYKGAPLEDQDLPIADAIPLLLAREDIKPFLPAPGGHQEGHTQGQRQTVPTVTYLPDGQPADPLQAAKALLIKTGRYDEFGTR